MKAQSVIFDILVHGSIGVTPKMLGEILDEIHYCTGVTPSPQAVHLALKLLVATGELVATGPGHDTYSTLYSKLEAV